MCQCHNVLFDGDKRLGLHILYGVQQKARKLRGSTVYIPHMSRTQIAREKTVFILNIKSHEFFCKKYNIKTLAQ